MTQLDVRLDEPPTVSEAGSTRTRRYYLEVFVASFAALLLEVCYTRVFSFKFFYYWTYLVIGLALLGIGSGGVLGALSKRLQKADSERVMLWSFLAGAAAVAVGYWVVAKTHVDTLTIWQFHGAALWNLTLLFVISVAVFVAFLPVGVILSTVFGRRPERIGRLYFFDLFGAGLACAAVVPLISWIGPPSAIFLAGALMAAVAIAVALRLRSKLVALGVVLVVLLGIGVVSPGRLPVIATDAYHINLSTQKPIYSAWNPVFRIDVIQVGNTRLFYHDGVVGSSMLQWNGKTSSLGQFGFNHDPRALPFDVLGTAPNNVTIIGAAGGREVVASLYFKAHHVDAVELNPTTYKLATQTFANYDGHLGQNPHVTYIFGDGRSYLARTSQKSNLIWYPAPDSYAATNASTASALVLSESYLYTTQAVTASLQHLSPNGILAAQFGEFNYAAAPVRTARYIETARAALEQMGISDPGAHILVATAPRQGLLAGLSTILVKKTPFTAAEIHRFVAGIPAFPGSKLRWATGYRVALSPVSIAAGGTDAAVNHLNATYTYQISPSTDDQPFFWHFVSFDNVIQNFDQPLTANQEIATGERVLVLLLGVTVILAALFLLLPFLFVRREWVALPRKGMSVLYFGAIGLGFIFYEITLIQKLTLFLGYPTYSLTVTLCSMLIFVGLGALLSNRWGDRRSLAPWVLIGALVVLTLFYLFGLSPATDAMLGLSLAGRIPIAFALIAPLGLCLGMFMPLGIGAVADLSEEPREYVAWSWAVNGFATVVGSVAATILAMSYGFHTVLWVALALYAVAVVTLNALQRAALRPGPGA